jgi:hypothetical protein
LGTGPALASPSLFIEPPSFPLDSIRLRLTRFYPCRLFELTREVFLLDQSDAHNKNIAKSWQEVFQKKAVEICGCLCKKIARESGPNG